MGGESYPISVEWGYWQIDRNESKSHSLLTKSHSLSESSNSMHQRLGVFVVRWETEVMRIESLPAGNGCARAISPASVDPNID